MKRRSFLKLVGGAAGGAAILMSHAAVQAGAPLPRRPLGRTGLTVPVVGFPGLALSREEPPRCARAVRESLDLGVDYFDVAPAYGQAEEKMGPALEGIDRSKYFLACKTKQRTAEGARGEMERSLQRLKTDHFDLYQLHHLRTVEEVKEALGPGGAMEFIVKAREQGKLKYIGFSAHGTQAALEVMKGFKFDTVMFPINFVELLAKGFGREVLDLAKEQGAAVLAIKALSRGSWPEGVTRTRDWWYRSMETLDDIGLALRFTLSQPAVTTGFPPAFLDLFATAVEAARQPRPLSDADNAKLKELASDSISVFVRPDGRIVHHHRADPESIFPGGPYDGGCPGEWA